jgi:MFS family permease
MMVLGMGGLTGGFLSGWLANLIGLRRALLLCFIASAILAFLLFRTNTQFSNIIFVEVGLLAFFFGASQGVLSVYIPQLFPTAIRGRATGICFNTGRVITASAVFFVGVLVNFMGGYGNTLFTLSWVFIVGWFVTLLSKRESGIALKEG